MDTIMMSDLKTGMLVETSIRHMQEGVVMRGTANGDIIVGDGWQPLNSLNMARVVKVSVPCTNKDYASLTAFFKEEGENLYTVLYTKPLEPKFREMTIEDVERLVGTRVKIIGDK